MIILTQLIDKRSGAARSPIHEEVDGLPLCMDKPPRLLQRERWIQVEASFNDVTCRKCLRLRVYDQMEEWITTFPRLPRTARIQLNMLLSALRQTED